MTWKRSFDLLFGQTIAKHAGHPDDAEDAFACSTDGRSVAVTDGASLSFDPRTWAQVLASAFVTSSTVHLTGLSGEWLASVSASYRSQVVREGWNWAQEAAFGLGSFSTMLGVRACERHDGVHLVAIGDTVAVLVNGGRRLRSFPLSDPFDFTLNPDLCSTVHDHNRVDANGNVRGGRTQYWDLSGWDEPILLCMTDALAQWALHRDTQAGIRTGSDVWTILAGLRTTEQLRSLVRAEQSTRSMRIDDVTLVTLQARVSHE
ncbi:MAG: hypothetical protein EBT09_00540 [Actinobacteria bacterium]|nr:hypothetical protein [Actinomycetota bacterium]